MKIFFLPRKPTNIHLTHCPLSLTKWSSTPTLVGQLMIKDYYIMMIVFGYQTPTTSISRFYSIIMIILLRDIMAKTRHWILSEGIIHGWVFFHLSRIIASLVRIAPDPKLGFATVSVLPVVLPKQMMWVWVWLPNLDTVAYPYRGIMDTNRYFSLDFPTSRIKFIHTIIQIFFSLNTVE